MSLIERPGRRSQGYPAYDMRRTTRVAAPPPPPPAPVTDSFTVPAARPTLFPTSESHEEPAFTPRPLTPIIPLQSTAGRSLLAVIAIMSFLAALTLGAVVLVRTAATDWQAQVSREMTIQVRPAEGRDTEADVALAADIARRTPGIAGVRVYSKEESGRLLEPWLGTGLALDALPIPRLIVVSLGGGQTADVAKLRAELAGAVPAASLDDHHVWMNRIGTMTHAAILGGTGVLVLMLAATVLLVMFATRGAMAGNQAIVEVLHFVGAKNRYISGQFQRHFLALGLKGAMLGGIPAIALFLLARLLGYWPQGTAGSQEIEAVASGLRLGPEGYGGILGVLVLVSAITAITSRWTVHRTLDRLD